MYTDFFFRAREKSGEGRRGRLFVVSGPGFVIEGYANIWHTPFWHSFQVRGLGLILRPNKLKRRYGRLYPTPTLVEKHAAVKKRKFFENRYRKQPKENKQKTFCLIMNELSPLKQQQITRGIYRLSLLDRVVIC